jgi:hypothetical protein
LLVCFDDSNFNLSQFLLFFRQLLKTVKSGKTVKSRYDSRGKRAQFHDRLKDRKNDLTGRVSLRDSNPKQGYISKDIKRKYSEELNSLHIEAEAFPNDAPIADVLKEIEAIINKM